MSLELVAVRRPSKRDPLHVAERGTIAYRPLRGRPNGTGWELHAHVAYLLPEAMAYRVYDVRRSMVVVVTFPRARTALALALRDALDEPPSSRERAAPPRDLEAFIGGAFVATLIVRGGLALALGDPGSVYSYCVLEERMSEVVAL